MKLKMIVPSVRPDLFKTLLASLVACPQLDEWQLYPVFQRYPQAELDAILASPNAHRIAGYLSLPEGQPVYPLRVQGMRRWGSPDTIWCNLDDDMEFLPDLTRYAAPVAEVQKPGVGVVSCNWVRSEAFLKGKELVEEWVKQPIVNMAGGMIYTQRVADLLATSTECAVAPFMFDDVQAGLTAYVHGYENFRYRGSLLIHRILAPGGLKVLFNRKGAHVLPDPKLLTVEASKTIEFPDADTNYYMPSSSNLTKYARARHDRNRLFVTHRSSA